MTWDLTLTPALDRPELLAGPVRDALAAAPALAALAQVCEIDPELAVVLDDLAVPVPA